HDDLAARSKFEGIADQVIDDLHQAIRIADDVARQLVADMHDELQTLAVRRRDESLQAAAQRVAQIKSDGRQLQFAGIHFGKIENIVDQLQQGDTRLFHLLQVSALV